MRFDAARVPRRARRPWATPPKRPPAPCVTISSLPNLPAAPSNAYEGRSSITETVPTGCWSGQLHIRNVSNRGLHFKFRDNVARFEQADPGFQDPLEIFNIHWYAGAANALRAYGEKVREMMDPGLIEIANEGAEYSALEYLEAVGRRSELAIHMGRFHAEYDFLLPRPWCPWIPYYISTRISGCPPQFVYIMNQSGNSPPIVGREESSRSRLRRPDGRR